MHEPVPTKKKSEGKINANKKFDENKERERLNCEKKKIQKESSGMMHTQHTRHKCQTDK